MSLAREDVEIHGRSMSSERRTRIIAKHGDCCAYPGCEVTVGLEVDHIICLALGGKDRDENLEPLCAAHHKAKTARDRKMIAKAKRLHAKANGTFPPSKSRLRGRGFAPTRNLRGFDE